MKQNTKGHWKKYWWAEGLGWGLFMFLCMGILFPLAEKKELTLEKTSFSLLYWLCGGLIYGFIMKLFFHWYSKRLERKKATEV